MKVANSTSGEEPWWIEDDETQLCDDNPDLHYGVCEFDTYDGICRHCKNLVHPDIHLIHLIHNDRNNILFFESEMLKSTGYIDGYFEKNWAKTYKSKLSEIWEEFAERDIMLSQETSDMVRRLWRLPKDGRQPSLEWSVCEHEFQPPPNGIVLCSDSAIHPHFEFKMQVVN